MDQEIRNKLRNVVTQCRRLLEDSISQELEGKYAIFARRDQVTADPRAKMEHLTAEEQAARQDILDHLAHIQARGFKPKDSLEQLIREIAFTHLNRLCAYKMMEAREVYVGGQKFREAVSRGINSNGVKFYLADHPEDERLFSTGQQDVAYRHFLDWLGGELSGEIGVLFNPSDPANRLYPRQTTLDEVLELLNGGGIKAEEAELRDQWPQIWSQDETIGWVYQYFTPKELRDQARKESQAPRNSYELAFRNQFFTPRYVVEFLTDNTLGRIWYEMRKGDTRLARDGDPAQCRYLVRRPTEIFLKEGEQPPKDAAEGQDDLSQEELLKLPVHIPHRPKKDPRELKILDPACGSGHFLLYCFDLLLTIYEEAYADPDLGPALKKDYPTLDALKRDVPRLILAHNLHGIDIDLRASQIAALALWLRCQRAYRDMGFKKDRPKITRSNFVCAEPMPGEEQMLKEFVGQLEPKVLGQVVEVVFDKMKLAGEAGSLLKIEEEIRDAIREAKRQYAMGGISIQRELFDKPPEPVAKVFTVKDITDDQFFESAESQVIGALRSHAEKAQTGQRLQRRLFLEDAERGFAFVDLCHKRYNVILMNPPFGKTSTLSKPYIDNNYPSSKIEIHTAFLQRCVELAIESASIGVLCSRTFLTISSGQALREDVLLSRGSLFVLADLGNGVLDTAAVEACALVYTKRSEGYGTFFRLLDVPDDSKKTSLRSCLENTRMCKADSRTHFLRLTRLAALPGTPFAYWIEGWAVTLFKSIPTLGQSGFKVAIGCQTGDNERFLRLRWEVAPSAIGRENTWVPYSKGGDYSPYYDDPNLLVNWRNEGEEIKAAEVAKGRSIGQSISGVEFHFCFGLTYPLVTNKGLSVRPLPSGCLCDNGGPGIFPNKGDSDLWFALAVVNSAVYEYLVRCLTSSRHWQVGYLSISPFPQSNGTRRGQIAQVCRNAYATRMLLEVRKEENSLFTSISVTSLAHEFETVQKAANEFAQMRHWLDVEVAKEYGLQDDQFAKCLESQPERGDGIEIDRICRLSFSDFARQETIGRISYAIGVVFGRWDVTCASSGTFTHQIHDAFGELPIRPPGMLKDFDASAGLELYGKCFKNDHRPMIVDDPDNADDVLRCMRIVLEALFGDQPDSLDGNMCRVLEVSELREYLRRPGTGGFWDDHISRYSKSRRKAPIYWLLQSSKKNYAIWLYYHRLDKDLLFKALVNYVEPKIRLEISRLESLRTQKTAAGDSGTVAKRFAKDVERQEEFLSELRDFEDKLRRAANLHLEPDLNDGVVLNIAPLWELVPWKEAKKYWDELLEGQYEWSSIGKQLRQKGLVK
jgi:hypothetical protein